MKVNFFRSADAFLYLPIYIAENLGIYNHLYDELDVDFNPVIEGQAGDKNALKSVVTSSRQGENLPIAICDPFAIFSGEDFLGEKVENFRVLGAFITKVPFWAIDGTTKKSTRLGDLKRFDNLIYYTDELQTGSLIGKYTWEEIKKPTQTVSFGREFELLISSENTIAITCDILSMAIYKKKYKTKIAYDYSQDPYFANFVTTALVTTVQMCEQYENEIITILQGLQSSLAILRSSRQVAESVCNDLAEDKRVFHKHHLEEDGSRPVLDAEQIKDIVDWIYDGDFYPQSLDISKEQWSYTLTKHSEVYLEKMKTTLVSSIELFDKIVANEYILEAQKRFVNNVGINLNGLTETRFKDQKAKLEEHYNNEIKSKNESISNLEEKCSLMERDNKAESKARLYSWLIFGSLTLILLYLLYLSYFLPGNALTILSIFLALYIPTYLLFRSKIENYLKDYYLKKMDNDFNATLGNEELTLLNSGNKLKEINVESTENTRDK